MVRAMESAGGRAVAIRADSGDAGAVKNAVVETVRTLGCLDVLVNTRGDRGGSAARPVLAR